MAALLALEPAHLNFADDGTPWSAEFADVYHASGGALAQAQHVFLAGNGLPSRWQDRERFSILETGFGLGHNFLATWQAHRTDPAACRRLHFISVEKHPFEATDLARAHRASGAPAELATLLQRQWPMLLPGIHRLEFDGGRVVLTLVFGDARTWLPQLTASVDALFLDGFAPDRNPAMWSAELFACLAQHCHAGTTLATWSVSGAVRQALAAAGFDVRKAPGFAGKRQMLVGEWPGPTPEPLIPTRRALIIGAGLAGTGLCERLAVRGWQMSLLEAGPAVAQGASGNLAGAFRPLPSADDNRIAQLTRAGFLYGLRHLQRLHEAGHPVNWQACGVLHVARDARQAQKFAATVAALGAPSALFEWLDRAAASRKAGQPCAEGAWWFPQGGWIAPPSLCAAQLAAAGEAVRVRFSTRVERLTFDGQLWRAFDAAGATLGEAEHVVLANAHDARRLAGVERLPLRPARGQVSHLPQGSLGAVDSVVCGSGYLTPAVAGLHALGASFEVEITDCSLREADHYENFAKLGKMLPDATPPDDLAGVTGRASLRPVSPDRLPMLGPLTPPGAQPGLWLLSGYGARGLVWGAVCAEQLASMMDAEPGVLPAGLGANLLPDRFDR